MPPFSCKLCGGIKDNKRPFFIDTGSMEDYVGVVYYCSICAEEFAKLIGYGPLKDKSVEFRIKYEELERRMRIYEQFIRDLVSVDFVVELLSQSLHPANYDAESVGTQQTIEFDSSSPEQRSDEQVHDSDVGELPSLVPNQSKFEF